MAFSRLIDEIENGQGKFDNNKQYLVKNLTNEDIIVTWGAKEPEARGSGTYVIREGQIGGPYPQFLAYHIVKELVNREMQKDGKSKFFGSAEHRAPYEDKYLEEVNGDVEEAKLQAVRDQEREKVLNEIKAGEEPAKRKPGRPKKEEVVEFAGANR